MQRMHALSPAVSRHKGVRTALLPSCNMQMADQYISIYCCNVCVCVKCHHEAEAFVWSLESCVVGNTILQRFS